MNNLTKNEVKLNKLINEIMNSESYLTPERDKQLAHILGIVTSLSQDDELKKLIELTDECFEYGRYF